MGVSARRSADERTPAELLKDQPEAVRRILVRTANRVLGSLDEAEDVANGVVVKVFSTGFEKFDSGKGLAWSYLAKAAWYAAIDHYRKKKRDRFAELDDRLGTPPSDDELLLVALRAAFEALPPAHREALEQAAWRERGRPRVKAVADATAALIAILGADTWDRIKQAYQQGYFGKE